LIVIIFENGFWCFGGEEIHCQSYKEGVAVLEEIEIPLGFTISQIQEEIDEIISGDWF